jgi:hypothetical protein
MFTTGGKTRELRFTQNALYLLERELKRPLHEALTGISVTEVQAMLWAGLEGARLKSGERMEPYTLYEAGDIIDELGGVARAIPVVMEAWRAAMPARGEGAEGKQGPLSAAGPKTAPGPERADFPAPSTLDSTRC